MSKDIWHTGKEIPDEDRYIVVKNKAGLYSVGSEFEYDLDRVEKWAYFDDFFALETELERTKKQLEIAVGALEIISDPIPSEDCTCYLCAQHALDQIKALEQKDKQ